MQKWWARIAASSAATPFGVILMQSVVWVGMSAVWISWSLSDPDPLRLLLAVLSPVLAFYWVVALLVGIQRRRAARADRDGGALG